MYKSIPNENITELVGPSMQSYLVRDDSFGDYLDIFKSKMMFRLSVELKIVIEKVQSWERYGNGIGFPGQVINEMIHHCKIFFDKCKSFQGREDLIEKSLHYIKGSSTERTEISGNNKLLDINLCIIGISGSGKTALMSKLAETY